MAVQGGGTPFPTPFLHPEWPPLAFALPLGVYRRRRALTVVSAAHTCVRWLGPSHCTKFGVRRSACRAAPRLPPGRPSGHPLPAVAVWSLRPCPGSSGCICSFSIRLCFLERLHGCGENGVPNQESWPRLSVRRHGLARGPRPSSSGPRQGDLAAPSRLRRCRHRHPPGPTPPPAPLLL